MARSKDVKESKTGEDERWGEKQEGVWHQLIFKIQFLNLKLAVS